MTFDDWLQVNSDELAEQMVIPLETVFNAATEAERARCLNKITCYVVSMAIEPESPIGRALEAIMHSIHPTIREQEEQ